LKELEVRELERLVLDKLSDFILNVVVFVVLSYESS
jgi:hypothetical protein